MEAAAALDDNASHGITIFNLGIQLWQREMLMKQGSDLTWWAMSVDPPNRMAYECDANLGSPAMVDCFKVQYQDLGPMSDSVKIGPETPKFLTEGNSPSNIRSFHITES